MEETFGEDRTTTLMFREGQDWKFFPRDPNKSSTWNYKTCVCLHKPGKSWPTM